ncbi:MAG: Smr/MutS family protein [Prevotellaceae bacterium]|nr:Smr/MutS family protein [Prevotellaceae bacterium]
MIYPNTFEKKIGFSEIRNLLKEHCISQLGKEQVDCMTFSYDAEVIGQRLQQVREFRRMQQEAEDFPLQYFFDMRQQVARLRLEGTHLEEDELFDLMRSLNTIHLIVKFLRKANDDDAQVKTYPYPALKRLTDGIVTFPQLVQRIDGILDKYGHIRDNASPALAQIRSELARTEGSVSRSLNKILHQAQSEGLVEKDVAPTLRDGRLVIPIVPAMKRKIRGIVHDESASGKTVFIEPTEVVEANNRIRELQADERREIIRILTEFATEMRPHVRFIVASYKLLAQVDFIRAKALFAEETQGFEPDLSATPTVDFIRAIHPLLRISLAKQEKEVVPLDIMLTPEKRILLISGPNAGGKSVCLKTVGLLQYMLQCGVSIPVSERSKAGVFENILIDIGDEQSIENDLSTYSSHLMNMKYMMRAANERTLILIDEFGTGTEPQIGGAIAESVLLQFCKKKAWGVITTHYQNLKLFADNHKGVENGAMLYDRHEMRPLFQLQIGQPGSSFAIEIARKTGLPEEVIAHAEEIVGSDYIQSDKYLQDIVRDKRYWEGKRQNIHSQEKQMQQTIAHYEEELQEVEQERKAILKRARLQAEELLKEANRRIENTIREIKEAEAEREATRRAREELQLYKNEVHEIDTTANDEMIERKMKQILARRERKEKRKAEKAKKKEEEMRKAGNRTEGKPLDEVQSSGSPKVAAEFKEGDTVRIKGIGSVGQISHLSGKNATVIIGGMSSKINVEKLEKVSASALKKSEEAKPQFAVLSRSTRETIDSRRSNFHQDLDIRGLRGDEALDVVMHFIDDAILIGMSRVRILHGTGTGALRQLVRQYLSTVPNVEKFHDEHVQFGGAGITVVDIG